ncbi:hypothetical protein ACROYT_G014617 [Oculina patagonica]
MYNPVIDSLLEFGIVLPLERRRMDAVFNEFKKLEKDFDENCVCDQQHTTCCKATEKPKSSELEYVGDRSLGVKAHKDLLRKPLDSSTERKTAPRHDGALRKHTEVSNTQNKLTKQLPGQEKIARKNGNDKKPDNHPKTQCRCALRNTIALWADARSPAVTVTATSSQSLWVLPRKFGGRTRMGIRESGAPPKNMMECITMTCKDVEDFIIHLECIDKQEVGGKSPNMEKEALKRAIQQLKNLLNLKEVVTDASSSIIKMMADEFKDIVQSKEYPQVSQSGMFIFAKEKSNHLSKTKGNETFAVWTDHIINHFWYCCSNCDGQQSKLKAVQLCSPGFVYKHYPPQDEADRWSS